MPVLRGDEAASIEQAASCVAAGELVAFPTETVYGLGARADNDEAVARIFRLKGRPAGHPLIVHVADLQSACVFAAGFPPLAQRLAQRFWPGPLSLVLPRRPGVGGGAAAGLPTIGLRCPDHPVARALLLAALAKGAPGIAAPSANRFGRVSPTLAAHVAAEFGPDLVVLDGGACREGIESAIVDCSGDTPALLRPGTLGRHALEQALGQPLAAAHTHSPRVPGSLESHYAPLAALHLVPTVALGGAAAEAQRLGPGHLGVYSRRPTVQSPGMHVRTMPDNAAAVAHELFATLREFDALGATQVWVEAPPDSAEWDGVRDRLQRASRR